MEHPQTPVIEIRNASLSYRKTPILRNVTLKADRGEIVSYFGPSGSGKTTLLKALGGIKSLKEGVYLSNGKDITHLPQFSQERSKIFGYFFPEDSFFESLSVRENLRTLEVFGNIRIDQRSLMEMCDYFEISDLLGSVISQLSSGQRERIGLIRAFSHAPEAVMLDEPGSHLDDRLYEKMMIFLKGQSSSGNMHISIASHDARIKEISNRTFQVYDSQIHHL